MRSASQIRRSSDDPASPDFELQLADLPYGLEDARHLLDLEQLRASLWTVLTLLLLLFLARWWRRRVTRRHLRSTISTPSPARSATSVPLPGIAGQIISLRDRHLTAGTFREGCHELAAVLRSFYEGLWSAPLRTRTVGEIQRLGEHRIGAEDGGATGRLFGLLEGLQFARRAPTAGDLEAVCDLAADVTSVHDRPGAGSSS
ncbi:MAG: hypothetical protein MPN21_13495 [Thermoanaerobaculia bacterium]|nr:hypothetical protein [Thermoanaerobaculia bacterium]